MLILTTTGYMTDGGRNRKLVDWQTMFGDVQKGGAKAR